MAEAELKERRLLSIDTARSGWMDVDEFRVLASETKLEIERLRSGKTYEEEVRENWETLKKMGGG